MKRSFYLLAVCLVLTGCGVDKESQAQAEAQARINEVQTLKSAACSAWTSGIVNDNNFQSEGSIIITEAAARIFAQLAAKDSTYDYASKAAYTLTAFNGRNLSNIDANLKPLILLAITDMKRACLG
ncbi:unannotated protein [freshwater metagenome]|uniref:Unannotated protein n=1 Tax=freshwater metagenome TaxID=449393 RepID=A0A6J7U210_9ZZZZ|nr:hypothetical protein [Actinomycetota bacterium]MTA60234.1 hypothetical protein [Actinomycetota bacterium]MUH47066.1 hypothetical protein [Actinomycetota bacterium]